MNVCLPDNLTYSSSKLVVRGAAKRRSCDIWCSAQGLSAMTHATHDMPGYKASRVCVALAVRC